MYLKDKHVMGVLLIGVLLLLMLTKTGVFCFGNDGDFHALAGFFLYDVIKWWVSSPTFSMDRIMEFVINYQAQFKFFGGISYYPPLHSLVIAFLCIFAGKSIPVVYLASAIETIAAIFFTTRLYEFLYGKRTKMFYLLIFFMALNPVLFLYGASSSLDPGLMLFSVLTIYYFILFIHREDKKYLYITALMFGLGVLMKRPMLLMIPVLVLAILLERKLVLVKRNIRPLLGSVLIALMIISPLILMELYYYNLGVSKISERTILIAPVTDIGKISNFLNMSFFTLFGNYLLIAFFFTKLWNMRRKRTTGELTMLLFIAAIFIFYNFFSHVEERYLLPAVPFIVILSVNGIHNVMKRFPKSRAFHVLLTFMVFTTPLICYGYNIAQLNINTSTDYTEAALFVSENSLNKTSVVSPLSRMQAVAFNLLDDENIFVVHTPFEAGGDAAKELELMLNTKDDCLPRPSKHEWERFGICHPPIGWAIIQEEWDGIYVPYKLKDILDGRDDFCLVNTIEGRMPNKRTFIYQRC